MITTFFKIVHSKASSIRCLSGNTLKIIALTCMVIDHVTKVFYSSIAGRIINPALVQGYISLTQLDIIHFIYDDILCGIGAIAFPIFAFLFAEGFYYTTNKKNFLIRLIVFALISEFPFDTTFFRPWGPTTPDWPWYRFHQNIFFTYAQAFCTLWLIQQTPKVKNKKVSFSLNLLIIGISCYLSHSFIMGDYGILGILLILTAYGLRNNRLHQIVGLLIIKILFSRHDYLSSFLISLILILMYNGKRGKCAHKYFFYIFYPAHIALLGLLDWFIFVVLWGVNNLVV